MKPANILVVFGATGDLTKRKLIPALYNLEFKNLLKEDFKIIGFARREKSHEEFRKDILSNLKDFLKLKIDLKVWERFEKRIYYNCSEFDNSEGYKRLDELIRGITKEGNNYKKIFYLAVASEFFENIVDNLNKADLVTNKKDERVVFEKPFGHDLESAKNLNNIISKAFDENQIYRIDHYLAKELVQNLLVLRFANPIFEAVWNKKYIDHVQITIAEDIGIEKRGGYYDKAGALRDVMQNHVLQLVALVCMELPRSFKAEDIRNAKVKVLESIENFSEKDILNIAIRGQYDKGTIKGVEVKRYKDEEGITENSKTETYAALKLNINNERWKDIPFYLRTGKRLKERVAEVVIVFKPIISKLFSDYGKDLELNRLVIRIQPEEGISLQFNTKIPGPKMAVESVPMDFCHECKFGPNTPEAYEKLLYDIILGDSTLFTGWEEIENSWKFIDTIIKVWQNSKDKLPLYEAGSWGPKEADELMERDGRKWIKSSFQVS